MAASLPSVTISRLQVEHLRETLGIGAACPRLSWQIQTDAPSWHQAGYEIECFGADGQLRVRTGRVESGQSVLVDWPFEPLRSREQIGLRVRVWGTDGAVSAWSDARFLETGLLHPADWSACFVSPIWGEDTSRSNPAPYLRREFELRSPVKSARLYITALGVYEAQLAADKAV